MIELFPSLCLALETRSLVKFRYGQETLIAEPYEYGLSKDGSALVAALVFEGDTPHSWRSFDLFEMQDVSPFGLSYEGFRIPFDRSLTGIIQPERRYMECLAPKFQISSIPYAERPVAELLAQNLIALQQHVSNFQASVRLYEFCSRQDCSENSQFIDWMGVAGRDGILTLQRFDEVRKGLAVIGKGCPAIWGRVDQKQLKKAGRLFRANFSNAEIHRDAVAHAGLRMSTPNDHERNAIKGVADIGVMKIEASHVHLSDAIIAGNIFVNSWRGAAYFQRLDNQTLYELDDVKMSIWRAFDSVACTS